jgi:hypothetical protein
MIASLTESESHRLGLWGFGFSVNVGRRSNIVITNFLSGHTNAGVKPFMINATRRYPVLQVALAASLRAGSRTTMIARVCGELLQEWRLQNDQRPRSGGLRAGALFLPPPAFRKGRHRRLARRLISVRRRASNLNGQKAQIGHSGMDRVQQNQKKKNAGDPHREP